MILDYEFNQRDHKFTISYINEAGMKSFYEFNVSRFKTYIPSPTGKYTNWDGTKCDIKYTDKPNKFSYREFIEELPKNIKDKLFARYKAKLYFWDIETEFNPDEKPDPQSAKFPITTISIVNPDLTTMVLGYKTLSPEQEKRISEKFREYVDGVEFAREHNIKGSFIIVITLITLIVEKINYASSSPSLFHISRFSCNRFTIDIASFPSSSSSSTPSIACFALSRVSFANLQASSLLLTTS